MATTITRTTDTDDDGTGTTGTIRNSAWKEEIYDQIDELFENGLEFGDYLEVTGDSGGVAAFAGDRYNHVLVAAGLNANPLTAEHQVGFYTALQGNANTGVADGFVCGFETGIGLAAGTYSQAVPKIVAYAVGDMGTPGAGASATRSWNFSAFDQTTATNNAVLAVWNATFSGNWFIYYAGTRKSQLAGGDLILPGDCYRTIDTDFLRLSGGNGAGTGANVIMFGSTHATNANQGQLNASGGWAVTGDFTTAAFRNASVTAAITASTTQTQGQGALTKEVNNVSTCANANDTVTLPAAVAGRRVTIFNNGAQTLQIFPASGDNLGAGVDTAATLAAGSNRSYVAYDATNWEID